MAEVWEVPARGRSGHLPITGRADQDPGRQDPRRDQHRHASPAFDTVPAQIGTNNLQKIEHTHSPAFSNLE